MITSTAKQLCLAAALVAVSTTAAQALSPESRGNWDCPYSTTGACPPKRQTYGFHQTKWRRWPGVVEQADAAKTYETTPTPAPEPEAKKTEPESTEPTTSPADDMPLPGLEDDLAPQLPRDDTPDSAPPRSEATPSDETPTPTAKSGLDEEFPFDEPSTTGPKVEPAPRKPPTKAELDEEDPFKDDPLFNDEAPAPPKGTDSKGDSGSAPARLPALSKSRAMRTPQSSTSKQASKSIATQSRGNSNNVGDSRNPLRAERYDVVTAESNVVPTASWQPSSPSLEGSESDLQQNPLRH